MTHQNKQTEINVHPQEASHLPKHIDPYYYTEKITIKKA